MPKPCSKEPTGIALHMKQMRISLGWSQDKLAQEVKRYTGTTISISTIKQYEEGLRDPSQSTIMLVSKVFVQCGDLDLRNSLDEIYRKSARQFSSVEILNRELYKVSSDRHQVEYEKNTTLVRWNGAPLIGPLRETLNCLEKGVDRFSYRAFIGDMTKTNTPIGAARQWAMDWLKESRVESMIFFGTNLESRMLIPMMVELACSGWNKLPSIVFCNNETEAAACLNGLSMSAERVRASACSEKG